MHVKVAVIEGLQGGRSKGSKGDQRVHEEGVMFPLQVEATDPRGLEVETSIRKKVPEGLEPAVS